MLDYIKSVLPRLQQYSKHLDDVANFADIPWVFLGDDGYPITYIFQRDNELLVSKQGNAISGKWKYLPQIQSLLIEYEDKKQIFNQGFLDDKVMVLRKDDTTEIFVLANKNKIPDLDVDRYLSTKIDDIERRGKERDPNAPINTTIKLRGHSMPVAIINKPSASSYKGGRIIFEPTKERVPDGTYKTSNNLKLVVLNGKVLKETNLDVIYMYLILAFCVIIIFLFYLGYLFS